MSSVVNIPLTPVSSVNQELDLWDCFYTLFPRHEARKDALKAWSRMSESDRLAAVTAIADWRQVWKAQGREQHLIPLPATWLNGERWTDEVPRGLVPRPKAAEATARVNAPEQSAVSRPPIPEHVLTMFAKLKEGR